MDIISFTIVIITATTIDSVGAITAIEHIGTVAAFYIVVSTTAIN